LIGCKCRDWQKAKRQQSADRDETKDRGYFAPA
jgi:hypothetical protein